MSAAELMNGREAACAIFQVRLITLSGLKLACLD